MRGMKNNDAYDKSRYSKDRYRDMRREREAAAAHDPLEPQTHGAQGGGANVYSRENAAERYGNMQRHASSGGVATRLGDTGPLPGKGGAATSRRIPRPVLIGIAVVLGVLLLACIIWYARVSINMAPSEDVSSSVTAPGFGEPYYVLLLGSDSRSEKGDVARADSIILCRVDEGAKQVTLISLPRDLRVEIPGHGMGKLNSSLTYGGFSGAIQAVSKEAGVPISYYAVIYFSGFKKLVNDLGGVRVEVPEGTYYNGTWVPAGKNVKINGKQALVLARCRHGNPPDQGAYAAGDFQRTKNQRNLMKAIAKKALKKGPLELPGLIDTVSQCVETNMPAYKMAFLANALRGMDTDGMYMAVVPSSAMYIDGVSYVVADEAAWQAMMERVKAGKDPNA